MSRNLFREYAAGTEIPNGDRRYVIDETLAKGKFGYAFACRDGEGGARLLRVVWPFSRSYENVRERWALEAVALRRLRHPGLVEVLDSFEHEGCFHLVHEFFDRRLDQDLAAPGWHGGRRLPAVACPLLGALDHLHRSGYTHKELHPQNVFRVADGGFKLGELAVNVLLGNVDVLNTKIPRWLVPPEYLTPSECGPMDHRVDIYQAGLLLLCVLRGRIVQYSFEEISIGLPAKDAMEIGSGYGRVLAQALQPRVEGRFQSALELREALAMD